jgi:hypothetical protein
MNNLGNYKNSFVRVREATTRRNLLFVAGQLVGAEQSEREKAKPAASRFQGSFSFSW